ncbi:MAG: MOSC domain-containing protein [Candidatus Dormibacteraeota bacterium]|nr:MOSC domain-containing protein [Candidatus Dormibacteraeota bacterium]
MASARVGSLHRYPLKGARAIDVEEAVVTPRGIEGDRRYMVVDAGDRFVSQREASRLALVTALPVPGGLRLGAPGRPWLEVPLVEDRAASRVLRLWAGTCLGVDQGDRAALWLGEWLRRPVRLVWQPETARRGVDPRYATGPGDVVSFADGFPLLVCSRESLADLNAHLETPVPMNRFRPSLVVDGWSVPWREDRVARLRAGDVELALVKQCARCVVTTVDQQTAERGREPLRTLARLRRSERGAMFGENAIPTAVGRVAVGDRVEVVEARDQELEPVWSAAES